MSSERQAVTSKRIRAIEAEHGESIEQLLRRLYYEDGLPLTEIGERLHVSAGTLSGWMIRLGINQRALAARAVQDMPA